MGDAPDTRTHHGTAIAVGGSAALILGPSGAGKSDLALRCLALAPTPLIPAPALLVADDRVLVSAVDGRLRVEAPATIRGQLEVRGMGVLAVPYARSAELALVVELAAPETIERLPDPPPRRDFLGISLPLLRVAPFEASAPVKLLLALARAARGPDKAKET
ncbi:MAG: HPr kinase/phosphatase C-terminal domain-containing protein [Hyphomicrobium sp.]|uniref:HPr kinase/phosphorylase n=1 Tax=Hyphomicrobium sp. TaxID=82 RepID=UPI001328EC33|nr:HPr kinase/phosphatase C-terminal domain-containing protein [Hyphomicrobium sp.]KAB2941837.1 MAG: aldolase [Hyphomicrobium sp.]MBZ0210597.1 HPr kinase/phosphatase C-terminal domain-containing protein [Hyphomicrobium sp.]